MKFPKKEFLDRDREKTVKRYITIFTLLTVVPSIYLAYNIVTRTIWEKSAKQFMTTEMDFPKSQVIASTLNYDTDSSTIEISMVGERIEEEEIMRLQNKLKAFSLNKTYLKIKQSGDGTPDLNMLRSDVLKDLYERNELLIQNKDQKISFLEKELLEYSESSKQVMDLAREAKINHSSLLSFSLNRTIVADILENKQDTVLMAYAKFGQRPNAQEQKRFEDWLKIRTKADTVSLIIQ
jgi:hypothetical protein